MKIFLDANILVSVLNKEYPLFTFTSRILSISDRPGYEVYTSPLCLAIAFYFASKKSGEQNARKKIAMLSEKMQITSVNSETVKDALRNPQIHDFEDGLEYYSAKGSLCKVIITEDKGDFYFSELPIYSAEEFLMEKLDHIKQ